MKVETFDSKMHEIASQLGWCSFPCWKWCTRGEWFCWCIWKFPSNVKIIGEPGRFLVTSCTTLVTRIISAEYHFDSMCYFTNEGIYGALNILHFEDPNTRGYELWSSKVCEGDLITCRICIPNELWSTCEALYIFRLFSDHVLKINFAPLSYQWLHQKSKENSQKKIL